MVSVAPLPPGTPASRDRHGARAGLTLVQVAIIVACVASLGLLFFGWLRVYFVIEGAPTLLPSEVKSYDVVATVAIALPVAGIIAAAITRSRGFVIAQAAILLVMLAAAFVFQVPEGRWLPQPVTHHLPSNYVPCYSGSGDCPGG
jgi:hypothetical protein